MTKAHGRRAWMIVAAAALGFIAGCAHYKVTDPSSGKVYYTKDIDHTKREGFIKFKDAKTDAEMTLQSSEVQKISKDEFETAVGKK